MAKVQISDVIIPEIIEKYALERTAAQSRLYRSGIVVRSPEFDGLLKMGGTHVDMRFNWAGSRGKRRSGFCP